jgi:hypothetical protein
MKRILSILLGLALVLGTVSTTFAQNGSTHKHKKGGHKGGTHGGPSK